MRQQSVNHSRPLTHTSSRQLLVAHMSNSSSSRGPAAEQQSNAAKSQVQRFLEPSTFMASFGLYLLAEAPAALADEGSPFQGVTANSLYVTLGLFLLTAPGTQAITRAALLTRMQLSTAQCWLYSSTAAHACGPHARAMQSAGENVLLG
jgi:hypothetical protein